MILKDLREMNPRESYRLLSSLIIPRPIAWVTTLGRGGQVNLAPFSSFMGLFDPPGAMINIGLRSDGSLKDTHLNLRERRQAVVHIAELALLEQLHASGDEAPPEVSEAKRLGLETVPSSFVAPPRLAAAPVALECELREEKPLNERSTLLILVALAVHVSERIWDEREACATCDKWQPVARLAAGGAKVPNYAALGARFSLGKPSLP